MTKIVADQGVMGSNPHPKFFLYFKMSLEISGEMGLNPRIEQKQPAAALKSLNPIIPQLNLGRNYTTVLRRATCTVKKHFKINTKHFSIILITRRPGG